mmetsp:Transcript_136650/g.340762  ORF Transcript_136650/g.340762 Transcript_136650/m.340762 type:complete len:622 (-) Transcript_136650:238-2103(-)
MPGPVMLGLRLRFAAAAAAATALALLTARAAAEGSDNCNIRFARRPLPDAVTRAVPTSDSRALTLAWQNGETISLQRFRRDCQPSGPVTQVVSEPDFWRQPTESGLADVASLGPGVVAVAWLLGGDVWVRIVGTTDDAIAQGFVDLPPVRANNESAEFRYRSQVQVAAASRSTDGFLVAWSSWQQDGDGWGVFARYFDSKGRPSGVEQQVNQAWQRFQWQPQLAWCQGSAWALWSNGTGALCSGSSPPEDCANGPMLRYLGGWMVGESKDSPPKEMDAGGKQPLASALGCGQDEGSQQTGAWAVPIWLEEGGREVRWNPKSPPGQEAKLGSGLRRPPGPRRVRLDGGPAPPEGTTSLLSLSSWIASLLTFGNEATQLPPAAPLSNFNAAAGDPGQVFMLAADGLLVMLFSDARGTLTSQLLNWGSKAGPEVFPARELAAGASSIRAFWDMNTGDGGPALVTCFVSGSALDDPNEFVCLQRRAAWLAGADGFDGLGMGMTLAVGMMLCLLVVFCVLRHCAQAGAQPGWYVPPRLARRPTTSPQLRELREQLADIPTAPPAPVQREAAAAEGGAQASGAASAAAAAAAGGGPSSVPVQLLVALRAQFQRALLPGGVVKAGLLG